MFDGRLPSFANTRSMRVAGGLGTVARVVGDAQEIYGQRLPVDDAIRRIEDPMLVICATVASLFPFVGTILYVIVRPPEYLDDIRERELEMQAAEARLQESGYLVCPHCEQHVEKDFLRCPNCMRKLKDPCANCGKPLDPQWPICPYCEAEVPGHAPGPRRRRRRTADVEQGATASYEAPPS